MPLFDRILRFTSGRYFFVPFITLLASDLNFKLSKATLELTSFVIGIEKVKTLDLIKTFPETWSILKIGYKGASVIGIAITFDLIYRNLLHKLITKDRSKAELLEVRPPPFPYDENKLQMIIGLKHERLSTVKIARPTWVIVDERGMYQNFLITGTIGTGKTASAMYPFTKQAMFYKFR